MWRVGVHVQSYTSIAEVLDPEDGRKDILCLLVEDKDFPDGGARLGLGLEGGGLFVLGGGAGRLVEVEEAEEGSGLCVLERCRGVLGHGRSGTRTIEPRGAPDARPN
jgi:hypothetical protein